MSSSYMQANRELIAAERKLLLVLFYYVTFGIVMLSYLAVQSADKDYISSALEQYFICEAPGSGADCSRSEFDKPVYAGLVTATFLMLGFLPCVNLIFVVSWQGVKEFCQGVFRSFYPTGSKDLAEKESDEEKELIVVHGESSR